MSVIFLLFLVGIVCAYAFSEKIAPILVIAMLVVPDYVKIDIGPLNIPFGGGVSLAFLTICLVRCLVNRKTLKNTPTVIHLTILLYAFFITAQLTGYIFGGSSNYLEDIPGVINTFIKDVSLAFVSSMYIMRYGLGTISKLTLIAIYTMSLYAVFCYSIGSNPYIERLEQTHLKSATPIFAQYSEEYRWGISGRQQATMAHPITFGATLIILSVFLIRSNTRLTLKILPAMLVCLAVYLTASRSVYLFIIGMLFMMITLNTKKIAYHIVALFMCVLCVLLFNYYGVLDTLSNVPGSSIEMRSQQFLSVFEVLEKDFFWGKGYKWIYNYLTSYGGHPTLLGFESLLFSTFVSFGLIGIIGYSVFWSSLYFKRNTMGREFLPLLLSYLLFCVFTGSMATMPFFLYAAVFLSFDHSNAALAK